MEEYNRILKSIFTWILAILLAGILCTSVLVYPPYAFISYRSTQEKAIMVKNLIIPSAVILICTALEYIRDRKIKRVTLILILITLTFNIIAGLTIKLFGITRMTYFIAGINFNLIPACFTAMLNDNDKIKPPKMLIYVSSVIQATLYVIFIITAVMRSYVFVAGLMYLAFPVTITMSFTVYLNAKTKIFKLKTLICMYIVNLIFIVYNTIWYVGSPVILVLAVTSVVFIFCTVIFALIDIKKF